MYAIIETGGKQYNVKIGDVIKVEKLDAELNDAYEFDKVLLISNDGDGAKVGAPHIKGATVKAVVLDQGKGKKVIAYKYKPKKGYHKKKGHRQPFTSLRIDAING